MIFKLSPSLLSRPQTQPSNAQNLLKITARCLKSTRAWFLGIATIFSLLFSPFAFSQNAIEAISANQIGNSVVVKITLREPLHVAPRGFAIQNPARIALDFPNTVSNLASHTVEIAQGEVRNIHLVKALDRTRMVFNLKRTANYVTHVQSNAVFITIDSNGAQAAQASLSAMGITPTSAPLNANLAAKPVVREIDFRRGKEGEGRVVIELPSNLVNADIKQKGQTIVVDLPKTDLPDALRRRIDVTDFGTPVNLVTAMRQGDGTRIVIEPKGLWEHSAYQNESQLVIDVKPIKEDPNKLTQGTRGYKGDKLSLNFQSIEVRAILQVIADFTNLNIITSETVSGNLTLRLKDVPWDQALDIILQAKGLDMRKNGTVLWIAPKDELAAKEKLDLEARAQIADLEPVKSQVFQLNYQKADDVKKMLTETQTTGTLNLASRMLSKRGSASADNRTNQLFVMDVSNKLEEIQKLIARIDIPIRQVLIEARIVEANDQFSKNLGVKLGFNDLRATQYNTQTINGVTYNSPNNVAGNSLALGNNRSVVSGNMQGVQDLSSQNGSTLSGVNGVGLGQSTASGNTNFVSLPAAAIAGASPASFAVSLFGSAFTRFINLEISALEADGKGKIVASPRVVTADQVKALIEQGTELPYSTTAPNGATTVAFRKANLKLEVTPQITPEGNIILDVDINKDSVGQTTTAGFAIDTKHVKTQVLIENGGTVVIGGIFQEVERSQVNKVPLLGDIPLLGNLFKNSARTNDRTELLIFLTPKQISEKLTVR